MKNIIARWMIRAGVGALILATPAFAATCSPGQQTFTMSAGAISTSGYTGDAATACITFGTGTVSITLTNDTASITNVPQLLDGFSFSFTGGGSVSALSSVSATNAVDCTDSGTCVTVGAANFDADGGSGFTSTLGLFYWGVSTTNPTDYGSGCTSTALSGTNPGFFAGEKSGCFALEPGAIVNSGLVGTSPSGLTTGPHNDLLLGPVTFTLTCTGCTSADTASSGLFYWGTDGLHNGSSVPEPTSILLLGTAMAFAGKLLVKRTQA